MAIRRSILKMMVLFILVVGMAAPASAHHGWRWTADGNFELTGIIQRAELGNPHGILKVDADGEIWTVEVGQPWRHDRVGLKDETLSEGTEIIIVGHRSADPDEKVVKAERVTVGGRLYNLYPNRD
ncbi:MAG TPA: DUF6152 family protein [Alphaproteobacteria bacterium]|nr:DUF6152 family protein [Alphaproteobacteria bacterium]